MERNDLHSLFSDVIELVKVVHMPFLGPLQGSAAHTCYCFAGSFTRNGGNSAAVDTWKPFDMMFIGTI